MTASAPKKVVFDTDAGVDDAHALLMLDGCDPGHIDLLGVTCVAGNVKLPQVLQNMSHIMEHTSFDKIPIYPGATRPLVTELPPGYDIYHGSDGLGNTTHDKSISQPHVDSSKHASQYLIDVVRAHPKEINICAVGPLTNLALAERLWPEFSSNLESLTIMGGNMHGIGNVTPAAEFNFFSDPEAAHIVLKDFKCRKVLVTWELTTKYEIPQKDFQEQFALNTAKARFVRDITQHALNLNEESLAVCDQLAVMCATNPDIITKQADYACKVSLSGETRGQVIIDRYNFWKDFPPGAKTTIVEELDGSRLQQIYIRLLEQSRGKPAK